MTANPNSYFICVWYNISNLYQIVDNKLVAKS